MGTMTGTCGGVLTRVWLQGLCGVTLLCSATGAVSGQDIVVNRAPAAEQQRYYLSAAPIATASSGGSAEHFVQVSGAFLSPSGRLHIRVFEDALRPTATLRTYGPQGEFLHESSVPLPGIRSIVSLAADSLLVWDGIDGMHWLDAKGNVVRSRQFSGAREATCCFGNGNLLHVPPEPPRLLVEPGQPRERSILEVTVLAVEGDRARVEGIVQLPGYEPRIGVSGRGTAVPFARRPLAEIAGDFLVSGDGDTNEFRIYDQVGRLLRIVQTSGAQEVVTSAEREALRASLSVRAADVDWYQVPFPATKPAYSAILSGGDGSVWLASYTESIDDTASLVRYDAEGKLLGTLSIPPRMRVHRVYKDRLILIEFGVDHRLVHVYGIEERRQ